MLVRFGPFDNCSDLVVETRKKKKKILSIRKSKILTMMIIKKKHFDKGKPRRRDLFPLFYSFEIKKYIFFSMGSKHIPILVIYLSCFPAWRKMRTVAIMKYACSTILKQKNMEST